MAPRLAQSKLDRIGLRIKLQITKDALNLGTQSLQSAGIVLRLSTNGAQSCIGRPHESGPSLRLLHRFLTHACVDQHDGNAVNLRTLNQQRPHFRLKQQTYFGLECEEKTIKHIRRIPRLPNLHIAILQKFAPFLAPSCCAICQQQFHPRHGPPQTLQQNGCSACFAQRDCVNPNPVLTSALCVTTQSLFNELAIKRLCLGSLVQLTSKQGLRQAHENAVKPKREIRNHSANPKE